LSQVTASGSIFQILAARSHRVLMTFSADCVTTIAEAKVTRLPPVRLEKPMLLVSPISTWILLWSIPSNSAAILAVEAREPPMSGWPVMTTTDPSSLMRISALDSPPALNQ
jgi:hypothetical protein